MNTQVELAESQLRITEFWDGFVFQVEELVSKIGHISYILLVKFLIVAQTGK